MSERLILRYRGPGSTPADEIERIRSLPGTEILDSTGRMLLVESSDDELYSLLDELPDWVMSRERSIEIPDTRYRIGKPPGRS